MVKRHTSFPEVFEDKLDVHEALCDSTSRRLSGIKARELDQTPIPGSYDLEHLAKIHEHLFQDVSSFAGSVRGYGMSKGRDQDGSLFARPDQMPYLFDKELPKRIEAANKSVNDRERYIDAMTDLHSTLDSAHPFREGNGRTIRAFITVRGYITIMLVLSVKSQLLITSKLKNMHRAWFAMQADYDLAQARSRRFKT